MSIAKPGRRLLQHVPLQFVRRKVAGGAQRPVTSSLSLTSMIDFLVVSVVFLLIMFDPSQSAAANGASLPDAINVESMIDAPMISVAKTEILLDGVAVESTRGLEASKPRRLDDLEKALQAKRETWRQLHASRPFPGAVVLQLDQDVPANVVKSLFLTATHAGYPAVSFMVEGRAE